MDRDDMRDTILGTIDMLSSIMEDINDRTIHKSLRYWSEYREIYETAVDVQEDLTQYVDISDKKWFLAVHELASLLGRVEEVLDYGANLESFIDRVDLVQGELEDAAKKTKRLK